ncbi:MAG: hypothetical protein ACJ768_01730 [Gaiellaceae bacterium]
MKTFLEYVCERLMGPPAFHGADEGDSYWCCPFHDDANPSFHTLPHKEGYKDSWKCWSSCAGRWGDEYDLLRQFHTDEDYPRQQVRLARWRQEWEREMKAEADAEAAQAPPSFLLPWTVELADDERAVILNAAQVMRHKAKGVTFEALAACCQQAEALAAIVRAYDIAWAATVARSDGDGGTTDAPHTPSARAAKATARSQAAEPRGRGDAGQVPLRPGRVRAGLRPRVG